MKIRLHLVPHLGGVRLAKLTALHVEQLYAEMTAAGDSAAERVRAGKLLRQALKHAVTKGIVPTNVADLVPLPRAQRKEMKVYDAAQVRTFLEHAKDDRLYAAYVLALDTGCRQGELFALVWPDIDFEAGTLTIQRSLEELRGRHRLKETMTAGSRRRIPISRFTLDALHDHRKAMLAEGRDVKAGPVFVDTTGKWLRKSNAVRYSFIPLMKRAGLPRIRWHDLRHTCATLLLASGEGSVRAAGAPDH